MKTDTHLSIDTKSTKDKIETLKHIIDQLPTNKQKELLILALKYKDQSSHT